MPAYKGEILVGHTYRGASTKPRTVVALEEITWSVTSDTLVVYSVSARRGAKQRASGVMARSYPAHRKPTAQEINNEAERLDRLAGKLEDVGAYHSTHDHAAEAEMYLDAALRLSAMAGHMRQDAA